MKVVKLFGVAGSGKTTYCLNVLKVLIGCDETVDVDIKERFIDFEGKYIMEDICFSSFTTASIKSIITKIERDGMIIPKFHNFRTLNSLTWRLCGYDKNNELHTSEQKNFFMDKKISVDDSDDEDSQMKKILSFYSGLINYTSKSLKNLSDNDIQTYWGEKYDPEGKSELDIELVILILRQYDKWKKENDKKDYVDSIVECYEKKIDIPNKILIVDEAQDLSKLQARLVDMWTKEYERDLFLIAGDDDQTVHEWSGATPEYLVEYAHQNLSVIKLEKTHRLPSNIAKFCNDILNTINYREKKTIYSEKHDGALDYITDRSIWQILSLVKANDIKKKKTYYLFRTNKIKQEFADYLFNDTDIIFGFIGGNNKSGRYWNLKFIDISNALNKLLKRERLLLREIKHLFDCLPSKTCLIYGIKAKLERDKRYDLSWKETLDMTKLWNKQLTLDEIHKYDSNTGDIKDKILRYLQYIQISDTSEDKKKRQQIEQNEMYRNKFRKIRDEIKVELGEDSKLHGFRNELGTFHSAKGLEAENVFVFLGTSNYFKEINDSERRCFYVACSRSLENLYLINSIIEHGHKTYLETEFKDMILDNEHKQ